MGAAFRLAGAWTGTLARRAASLVAMGTRRRCRAAVAAVGATTAAALVVAVAAGVLGAPQPAGATLPGENGRLLIQGSGGGRYYDLFSVNPDGSGEQRLTNSVPRPSARSSEYAAWSPDGTRIAFIQVLESYNAEIFVMNADGTGKERLTFTAAAESHWLSGVERLAWSADGSKLFYERGGSIWTMNADGSRQRRLPYRPSPYVDAFSLSPDGQKLALIAYGDRGQGVWVMDSDGSGLTKITRDRDYKEYLGWSPDSARLVFTSSGALTTMKPDGTERVALTEEWGWVSGPTWSPDGTRIAFSRSGGVWTINADGTGESMLSEEGNFSDYSPEWSPDSSRIAFTRYGYDSDDGSDVHVVNSDGSGEHTVIDVWRHDDLPDWQTLRAD